MTEPSPKRASTQVSKVIKAPRTAIYRACLDPNALAVWRVPDNMEGHVEAFDAHEGGRFRMSLTYKDPVQSPSGKTSEGRDTFQGRFIELIPDERIVEVVEFESPDPSFAGEMKITTTLTDIDEGTVITVLCEDIPAGVRAEENELGTEQALQKLARLLE
jgi:uncharacterized protein YndB with AHSA1/START domain